jgi:hypothetical protein
VRVGCAVCWDVGVASGDCGLAGDAVADKGECTASEVEATLHDAVNPPMLKATITSPRRFQVELSVRFILLPPSTTPDGDPPLECLLPDANPFHPD